MLLKDVVKFEPTTDENAASADFFLMAEGVPVKTRPETGKSYAVTVTGRTVIEWKYLYYQLEHYHAQKRWRIATNLASIVKEIGETIISIRE